MAKFTGTVMVSDGKQQRAVKVWIDAPEGVSVLNVQELAEQAWRSINKRITINGVTVKVERFGR